MIRWICFACLALFVLLAMPLYAAPVNPALYGGLHWRLLGPFRGGRVVAVTGVPGQFGHFYFGAADGGVWETHNAGRTWTPIFDGQPVASIGAIAVAPSDPDVIYVGTGEADIRESFSSGNGVYKSVDGGKTWEHAGLTDTHQIGDVMVDPSDPDTVYVAALGDAYAANPERGVYKSTDGGHTWKKVLYENANVGAVDLAFGADHTVFAAMWQTRRPPWSVYPPSNGPGSGLYVSRDAGKHWKQVAGHGFPDDHVGRIGVAVAPGNPQVVYANVDAKGGQGGLYRSTDGGVNWVHVTADPRIWARWWYFGKVTVDPKDADTVYIPDTALYKSTDGGKTFVPLKGSPGGDDYRQVWVDPDATSHMIVAADQGAVVTLDGGKTWSSWYNQPTGQFYHVTTDNQFPFNLYAAQQDSGAIMMPVATPSVSGITRRDIHPIIAGAESDYIVPDPLDPRYVYGPSFVSPMVKYDTVTKQDRFISPMLDYPGITYRKAWTVPLVASPIDPHVMYYARQMIFRTHDGGRDWTMISPDLSRKDPGVPASLDPATASDTTVAGPRRGVVFTMAPSPVRKGEIWAGTDDGLIWLTRDEGKHWENVTPKRVTAWSKVSMIEASHFDAGTAYAAVDRHRLGDDKPYVYVTHDFGNSWNMLASGIADDDFVHVVREDPAKRGVLYAATEHHVYVSFDGGADWQSLQLNLPVTSMRDLVVHGDDLVLATFGRGLWILDDIAALRQVDPAMEGLPVTLFKPAVAYRVRPARLSFYGVQLTKDVPQARNPPRGAVVDYYLASGAKGPVTLEILDARGTSVRRYSSATLPVPVNAAKLRATADWILPPERLSAQAGMHRFVWDLRYPLPTALVERQFGENQDHVDDGIWAPPGSYTVRLTVDGHTYSQPLDLKEDPRIEVTQADLLQQLDLAKQVQARRVAVADASRQAADVLKQLEVARASAPARLRANIDTVAREVRAVAGVGPQANPDNSVGVAPTDFSTLRYVSSALADLQAAIESADSAPHDSELQAFGVQGKAADRAVGQWNDLKQSALRRLNATLRAKGLAGIRLQQNSGK